MAMESIASSGIIQLELAAHMLPTRRMHMSHQIQYTEAGSPCRLAQDVVNSAAQCCLNFPPDYQRASWHNQC